MKLRTAFIAAMALVVTTAMYVEGGPSGGAENLDPVTYADSQNIYVRLQKMTDDVRGSLSREDYRKMTESNKCSASLISGLNREFRRLSQEDQEEIQPVVTVQALAIMMGCDRGMVAPPLFYPLD